MTARALGLIAVVFLALQIAVPATALFAPRPQRFGWHMYSALPPVPDVSVVGADGTEDRVELEALFVVPRAEIDYATALRDRLCGVTHAVAIRHRSADGEVEEVACQ